MDLFAAPWWFRLAGAMIASLLAWAAVWLVEGRDPPTPAVSVAAPATDTRTIAVTCTAGRPVAHWRVAVDGTVVAGKSADQSWSAQLAVPVVRCELVVEADPGRGGPTALRVQVDGAGPALERTAWADGPAQVTLLLPGARR
jgi:hypothetical protein